LIVENGQKQPTNTDVSDVGLVVNYDFPGTIETYVHRVGRTGRAGRTGKAISFFTPDNFKLAKELITVLSEAGQPVPPTLHNYAERARFSGGRKNSRRGGGGGNNYGRTGGNSIPLGGGGGYGGAPAGGYAAGGYGGAAAYGAQYSAAPPQSYPPRY